MLLPAAPPIPVVTFDWDFPSLWLGEKHEKDSKANQRTQSFMGRRSRTVKKLQLSPTGKAGAFSAVLIMRPADCFFLRAIL